MLLTPNGAVAPEWQDLARKLNEGDGIQWTGDPRLWLGIGVLKNTVTGKEGRRLEVWRDNEDGTTALVGHWLPAEQIRVCYDLARMRVEAPGHVDVITRIDAHNDAKEKADTQTYLDTMGPAYEHAARLFHERTEGKNRFFVDGTRDTDIGRSDPGTSEKTAEAPKT